MGPPVEALAVGRDEGGACACAQRPGSQWERHRAQKRGFEATGVARRGCWTAARAAAEVVKAGAACRNQKEQKRKKRHCPELAVLADDDDVFVRLKDRPMPTAARFPKLDPAKLGPFKVSEVLSRHRVCLALPPDLGTDTIFNVSQVNLAPAAPDPFGRPLAASPISQANSAMDEPEYKVERIIAERKRYGHLQYQVKWKDDPRPTWEFANNLAEGHCEDVIAKWRLRDVLTPPPADHHWHEAADDSLVKHPIAFISTTTSLTKSKMAAIELKISGLAWALHRLQHYLDGAIKIIVITDHAPLPAVLRALSHSQRHFTPRIEKLRAYLMPYLERMEFRYKPGKLHANVDALS
ncbi:uncharacterized protein UTRI_02567 [Ustilago trichophora]|uniref:Chromo domain-containing protein n=1 Tax=Ustilago trichophora TaxID=86804 RepID=A0A5C3E9N0_9BASI|nr:uncharacterized protein UTRI_02567 [Ustilago trichophora]